MRTGMRAVVAQSAAGLRRTPSMPISSTQANEPSTNALSAQQRIYRKLLNPLTDHKHGTLSVYKKEQEKTYKLRKVVQDELLRCDRFARCASTPGGDFAPASGMTTPKLNYHTIR